MDRHPEKTNRSKFRRVFTDQRGSITIEAALGFTALLILLLGIVDFGLAYTQKMGIENAVKAGIQYSIVRKPVQGDLTQINQAVLAAAPTPSAGQLNNLSSILFCECDDGSSSACLSSGSGSLSLVCADGSPREAFIRISLNQSYKLLFPFPAFGSYVKLTNTETMRLN